MPLPVTIDSVLRRADLPPMPELYLKLNAAVNNQPQAPLSAISNIISEDPSLAARLLKIANSAMFRFPSQIDSISAAVDAIGVPQIHDLALSVMMIDILNQTSPDIVSIESYWRHSIACGIVARTLAEQRNEPNIEQFFIIGLLHDIGSLLLYAHIPEQSLMAILHDRDVHDPLYRLEQTIVGFDHAQLGGVMLNTWHLPETLQEAVALHHAPESATHHPVETATAHLADIIVLAMELGSRGEYIVPPLSPEAWDRIGLPDSALSSVIEETDRQFASAFSALYE